MGDFLCLGGRLARLVAVCVAVGFGAVAWGQTPLGLLQAYRLALENDANLKASRYQAVAVGERVIQAKAQLRPNLSLSVGRFHNDLDRTQPNLLGGQSTTNERYFSYNQTLQLRQPLYRPALTRGVEVAQAQQADAQALFEKDKQSTAVKVVEAYLQALQAQEVESVLMAQRAMAKRQLDAAQKRFDAGQGVRTDVDETLARIDLLAAQSLEAQQTRETALLQLRLLTQAPASAVHPLDIAALGLGIDFPNSLDHWVHSALKNSPELRALAARVEAARWEVKRAQSSHQPTLDALVQVSRSGSENVTSPSSAYVNRQVGLQFNLPLYSGGGVQSLVRQALADQSRAEELVEAARRDLEVRVQREWRAMTEGARRALAMQKAVASADQMVRSVSRSFEAGVRTALDVLNAEDKRQEAQRDFMTACLSHVAGRLRLLALAGELDDARVQSADAWFTSVN